MWYRQSTVDKKLTAINERIAGVESRNHELQNKLRDANKFASIGIPKITSIDYELGMLYQARVRGYFDVDNVFESMGYGNGKGYYKHSPSDISENYSYLSQHESVRIPVKGVSNATGGTTEICSNGKWAWIGTVKQMEKRIKKAEKEASKWTISEITMTDDGSVTIKTTNKGEFRLKYEYITDVEIVLLTQHHAQYATIHLSETTRDEIKDELAKAVKKWDTKNSTMFSTIKRMLKNI